MSIAEQMGRALQRTSISTNIKGYKKKGGTNNQNRVYENFYFSYGRILAHDQ